MLRRKAPRRRRRKVVSSRPIVAALDSGSTQSARGSGVAVGELAAQIKSMLPNVLRRVRAYLVEEVGHESRGGKAMGDREA